MKNLSVSLLALFALSGIGCSAAGEHVDDLSVEAEFGSAAHVCDGPADPTSDPTTPDPEPGHVFRDPMRHTLTVSDEFTTLQQEAILVAIDTIRQMTGGLMTLDMVVAPTECDMPWAIHAAPQGECHLTGNDDKGYRVGWFEGSPFKLTVRNLAEDGVSPSERETYTVALHEMGHALGLAHGEAFMHPNLANQMADTRFTTAQAERIAEKWNWPRETLVPGVYQYDGSH
jgi:hypothetical protein